MMQCAAGRLSGSAHGLLYSSAIYLWLHGLLCWTVDSDCTAAGPLPINKSLSQPLLIRYLQRPALTVVCCDWC